METKELIKDIFTKKKIDYIDANKTLLSRKEPYGANKSIKCFSGYSDYDNIKLLCIRLPQMTGFFKIFDRNKRMSLKISDKKMLKKRIKIQEKLVVWLIKNLIAKLYMAIVINT